MKNNYSLSASIICANQINLENDIKLLEKAKIDYIHFDVMDGVFVPRYGMYPEQLSAIKKVSKLPVVVHMMTEEPEKYLDEFIAAGADTIIVHAEACRHLHHTLKKIKDGGIKSGVALNYATSLSVLDYIIDYIDIIEIMAINPGIVGHKVIPEIYKKISDLKKIITKSKKNILIEIDGGVNSDTAINMIKAGADILVCGTSSIFKTDTPVNKKIIEFRSHINQNL